MSLTTTRNVLGFIQRSHWIYSRIAVPRKTLQPPIPKHIQGLDPACAFAQQLGCKGVPNSDRLILRLLRLLLFLQVSQFVPYMLPTYGSKEDLRLGHRAVLMGP